MAEKRQLEFFLLRYVPHAIRERYVDFGLILREPGNEKGFVSARFAPNWREVLRLDAGADVEILEALQREIKAQLSNVHDQEVLLRWLEDSYSNTIQLSARRTCLAEDPEQELEVLASIYLSESPAVASVRLRKESGRRQILNVMQTEFERVGVWDLLIHGIPVAKYTRPDDAFKFDFGYRAGGKLKLFHAVSLKASVNAAIEVASKYRKMSTLMAEKEKVSSALTAVIDDGDREDERVSYTLSAMGKEGIQIGAAAEMPGIAEAVRRELRA
ncbi:MAG: DUF3037 domain-containing protein [Candidatus Sulfotelmatobacter sp.]